MTTNTTTHLRAVVRWLDRPIVVVVAVANVFVVTAIAASIGRYSPEQVIASMPTQLLPSPVIVFATQPPLAQAAQGAAAGPNTLAHVTVVYDAPGGAVIGGVEAGRHYGYIARSGPDWVYLNIDGSGDVWAKAADLLGTGTLADIATPTSAPAPIVVSAPAAAPSYQVDAAPTPQTCFHSERQAMVQGMSIGLATGDSCISQHAADVLAVESAFAQMNAALQGGHRSP